MIEKVVYFVGFCIFTIGLQGVLFKVRRNHNKGKYAIWVGNAAIAVICLAGIINNNVSYLYAVLGFILGDEIGKAADWH